MVPRPGSALLPSDLFQPSSPTWTRLGLGSPTPTGVKAEQTNSDETPKRRRLTGLFSSTKVSVWTLNRPSVENRGRTPGCQRGLGGAKIKDEFLGPIDAAEKAPAAAAGSACPAQAVKHKQRCCPASAAGGQMDRISGSNRWLLILPPKCFYFWRCLGQAGT